MVSDQKSNIVVNALRDAVAAERIKLYLALEELDRHGSQPADKLDGLFHALSALKNEVAAYAGIHMHVAPENRLAIVELKSASSARRYTITGAGAAQDRGEGGKRDLIVREYIFYFFASMSSTRVTPCDSIDDVMRLVTTKVREFVALEHGRS